MLIHECGWYLKTHLEVRRVSRSKFNSTIFSLLSKGHRGQLYPLHLVNSPHLANPFPLVNRLHLNRL